MLPHRSLPREAVLGSTTRQPFSCKDQEVLLAHLHSTYRDRLDLTLSTVSEPALEEMLRDGTILLKSVSLHARFMLVHVCAGRRFLGLRNSKILIFYSALSKDEWIPLLSRPGLKASLAEITRMYRYAGTSAGAAPLDDNGPSPPGPC